jgi:hypothetical protein
LPSPEWKRTKSGPRRFLTLGDFRWGSVAATTSYIAALFILLPVPLVVLTLAAVPAVAAALATTATDKAEQRQSSYHGEALFEESPAAHAAPPFCQPGDVLAWRISLILRQQP